MRAATAHDASVEPGIARRSTSRAGRPTAHRLLGRVIPDFVCEGIDLGKHLSRLALDID